MDFKIRLDERTEQYYAKRLKPLSFGEDLNIKHYNSKATELEEIANEIYYLANLTVDPEIRLNKSDVYKFIFRITKENLDKDFSNIQEDEINIMDYVFDKLKVVVKKINSFKRVLN
ncbi:MAG: hypothetical protein ACRC0G_12445 [Fusobacteriaceae bacterium]